MKFIRLVAVVVLFLSAVPGQGADVRIASWNIQNLGWGEQKNYEALARVAGRFDLVAIQEVMNESGLERLERAIVEETGEPWESMSSHRIGRGSYREAYAFLWRPSRIEYAGGALVYLDNQNDFAREPYAARFATADGAHEFVLATIHILYGDSRSDRTPEIRALSEMWAWLTKDVFSDDENFILLGDFNLAPPDPAFAPLLEHARPLITRGATTLSSINGRYANLYDNLFISDDHNLPLVSSGIFRYPMELGWSHEQARRHVSDHAPVFIEISSSGSFPQRVLGNARLAPGASSIVAAERSEPKAAPFRGNRNSRILHHPGCPGYEATAAHNRVSFTSEAAAVEAGYRRARNCEW